MERHKKDFVLMFVNFLKRCKENVPIISNNGEHKSGNEDEVSQLKIFSCKQ